MQYECCYQRCCSRLQPGAGRLVEKAKGWTSCTRADSESCMLQVTDYLYSITFSSQFVIALYIFAAAMRAVFSLQNICNQLRLITRYFSTKY